MAAMDDRERLAQVEVRVEEQGGRLIELSQQVRDLDRKVDRLSERVDTKFSALDAKLDKMAEALDARLDKQTESFDQKLETIATRFNRVDDNFKWLVGINATMWATTVGALIVVAGLILSR